MNPRSAPPPELAGRWLSKFFIDHLAGERAASPKTVSSYRDAMKLLLTWFRDAEHIPPEKLRLADIDRPRVLGFLLWLEAERNCSASSRNQRLAVIKSFCRYTAVEQPDHLDQVTQVLAIRQKKTLAPQQGHLTGDEVKALLDGADLDKAGQLEWRKACSLMCDIASSLAILHSRGLLHRDVSARNVRQTADGRAKLLDFGTMLSIGVVARKVREYILKLFVGSWVGTPARWWRLRPAARLINRFSSGPPTWWPPFM